MPLRKLLQRCIDVWEKLDLARRNRIGKRKNLRMTLWRDWRLAELLEAIDERSAKTLQSIAVRGNRRSFTSVQMLPNLLHRMDLMVEEGDERHDRSFEINVVFPEGVVRVNQQRLVIVGAERLGGRRAHVLILRAIARGDHDVPECRIAGCSREGDRCVHQAKVQLLCPCISLK